MYFGKLLRFCLVILLVGFSTAFCQSHEQCGRGEVEAQNTVQPSKENMDSVYRALPGEGKRCSIDGGHYFIYKFDKRPKLGTAILKIQLFNKQGKKDASLKIIGNYGMPSMRGAHDSGDLFFKLNQKGVYLLPVNLVMPGEWEIRLRFIQDEKVIYRGGFKLDV